MPGRQGFDRREEAFSWLSNRTSSTRRKIRAEKEKALGALTPEAKEAANARVRAAQAQLRDHLAAHPKLTRLPYREQIDAGSVQGPADPREAPSATYNRPWPRHCPSWESCPGDAGTG
ncbi:hypothetical protein J2S55_006178 [Streptosporangium brasiliense]|uniref:Uncharacterized protein n=1 Tax=Streptosporangium brasiliense TaxID=47480 RepID=A0ABT9RCD3_9ACTN|nr:hypothetical protein [Streptosporangium brasiliense]